MPKQTSSVRDFIENEMRRRKMGTNEFARLCGVPHSQISKYIKSSKQPTPTIAFLRRLCEATDTPLSDMLAIAFPEIRKELKVDPDVNILARRIMKFKQNTRNVLIGIIESFEQGGNNH